MLRILVEGASGDLDPSGRQVVAHTRLGFSGTHSRLDRITSVLRNQSTAAVRTDAIASILSKTVRERLENAKRLRRLNPEKALQAVADLVDAVDEGDYAHADSAVKAEVFYWAARLAAAVSKDPSSARAYQRRAMELDPSLDDGIIEALILDAEGSAEDAIGVLRGRDGPDARTVLFALIEKHRGREVAIESFDQGPRPDDISLFTNIGWCNLAIALAQEGYWQRAVNVLGFAEQIGESWPEVFFLQGLVNAALLLPQEQRSGALDLELFSPAVVTTDSPGGNVYRQKAVESFGRARDLYVASGDPRAGSAELWLAWLRLTDPTPQIREDARTELAREAQVAEKAIDLLPVLLRFEIPFDRQAVLAYLQQRSRVARLQGQDLAAEFSLNALMMTPREFRQYLVSERDRLLTVLSHEQLIRCDVEAAIRAGQLAEARQLLQEHRETLDSLDAERLTSWLETQEGDDPTPRLVRVYNNSGSLLDLHFLVEHLARSHQWQALESYVRDLFERERTLENARRLVDCLQHLSEVTWRSRLETLEAMEDLVERDLDLLAVRAWTLFHLGRGREALVSVARLRTERQEATDLQLEVNLAVQLGHWERFSSIVDREFARAQDLGPRTLLMLTNLSAEADSGPGRAMRLLRLAAEKGSEDAEILASAAGIAYRLGTENAETAGWLDRALQLSSETGPLKAVPLATLVEEIAPKHRAQLQSTNEALLRGEVPLHLAAAHLNLPLVQLIQGIPTRNQQERDGRLRVLIPIASGARQPKRLDQGWSIAADLTSLLLWQHLGILEAVLQSVRRVWLPLNLMVALLNERIAVRFHQPSQVRAAEELRRFLDRDRFTVLTAMPQPPGWLVDEVGLEVAQLLEVAREQGGTLIKPLPIKRARSLGEENAELREYSGLTISAGELERLLHGAGLIDDELHKDAFGYLAAREESAPRELPPEILSNTLLVDDLALTYFQHAGILPQLANAGLRLCIHPSVAEDRAVLVISSQEGERLVEQIDKLRTVLRDAIERGQAAFLPERAGVQREGEDERYSLPLILASLFQDAPPYDAIAIDDRNLTRHQFYVDTAGRRIPVVSILDILRHLQERGELTRQAYFAAIHRLRASGFVLLPLDVAELQSLLRGVRQWEDDGAIVETAELRVLRQSVSRIRALGVVSVESEVRFLESLRLAGLLAIKSLWTDYDLPIERVEALATWVWRHICPAPWEWVPQNTELAEATAQFICPLLLLLAGVAEGRREVVQNWLEREVLSPILVADASIASRIGELVAEQIAEFVAAYERDNPD